MSVPLLPGRGSFFIVVKYTLHQVPRLNYRRYSSGALRPLTMLQEDSGLSLLPGAQPWPVGTGPLAPTWCWARGDLSRGTNGQSQFVTIGLLWGAISPWGEGSWKPTWKQPHSGAVFSVC